MPPILQYLANGIVFSSIIVLGSVGLSIIYGIADFANFAHGDTMTVGAYGALVAYGILGGVGGTLLGLPVGFYGALLVGMGLAAVVAVVTELVVYRPLNVDSITLLITSIDVAFVYRAVIQAIFGNTFRNYAIGHSGPIPVFQQVLGIAVIERGVVLVVGAVVLLVLLHHLLQYTTLGRKMRAMADNPDLARVSGIRTNRVLLVTWLIGAGLAGAGGVFLGLYSQITPRMGFDLLLIIFAAVILGGLGSVYGAMLGGFIIGIAHELTPLLSDIGLPIGAEYASAVAFIIMVVVLFLRPTGIAGGETA